MTQTPRVDVAVIGSGFAGSLTALALGRSGRSVALIERGRHPRFAIGESSTPLANLLIEELAATYDLPRIAPLSKWGAWQRAYPALPVGLKRGFSFFHHTFDAPFADDAAHQRQLLVAASPHDAIGDTHWYRPGFDAFLAREAADAGAELLEDTCIDHVRFSGDWVALDLRRHGRREALSARFVIDASGPNGALSRLLQLPSAPTRWLPPTQALYAHFQDVSRWQDVVASPGCSAGASPGTPARPSNDRRRGTPEIPPYPVDDAALHHVFPGGWIWMLRFNNGLTSAGAAVTAALASELVLHDGASAWDRLLERLPSIRAQFAGARAVTPFVHAPRIAYRSQVVCGDRWALLPSAAGVIDPLLSTGFPLTLLGIRRLVEALAGTWDGAGRDEALATYQRQTLRELDATERLVAALYASMDDFALFKRLCLLYFAAASYSEAARRLGRHELAPGFLLCDHAAFAGACAAICEAVRPPAAMSVQALTRGGAARRDGREAVMAAIERAIEPFDLAGLADRRRRDWYPVLADDLMASRHKLNAGADEIVALLERCGFECQV